MCVCVCVCVKWQSAKISIIAWRENPSHQLTFKRQRQVISLLHICILIDLSRYNNTLNLLIVFFHIFYYSLWTWCFECVWVWVWVCVSERFCCFQKHIWKTKFVNLVRMLSPIWKFLHKMKGSRSVVQIPDSFLSHNESYLWFWWITF